MSKEKIEALRTPFGVAKFCYLTIPYVSKEQKDKEEGKYKIDLILDPAVPEHKAFLKQLQGLTIKHAGKGKKAPYKKDQDKDDNGNSADTGLYAVTMHSRYKPDIFDSARNKIEANVGEGSVLRCFVNPKPYEGFGGGLTLYLQAVQVKELETFGSRTAAEYGFDDIEGGYTDDGVGAEFKDEETEEENFDSGAEDFENELDEFDTQEEKPRPTADDIPGDLPF